jgi:hypothetical protein
MTRFADQLFDDLIQEHGPALAATRVPTAPRRHVARPALLAAGAGAAAIAVTAGFLTAGGGTPAYAVTSNADGTVTLAVHDQSGIAGANQALHKLGDNRVVVVPVRAGCPTLPRPKITGPVHLRYVRENPKTHTVTWPFAAGVITINDKTGVVTVKVKGIPAGQVAVVAVVMQVDDSASPGMTTYLGTTRAPGPTCVSIPGWDLPGPGYTGGTSSSGSAPTKSPRG